MKTIVAAVDFSDMTGRVVEYAGDLACKTGAEFHLIHVVDSQPAYVSYGFRPDEFPMMMELQVESSARAEKKLSDLDCSARVRVVKNGNPKQEIMEYVSNFEDALLVVGSHGHSALGSLLMGSVAEYCVRKASVPTLVVPSGTEG